MKKLLTVIATLALAVGSVFGTGQTSDFTGLDKGTDWFTFCDRMDNDATALAAHAATLQLAELAPDSAVALWLATPNSANLKTALSDETGSGALVFATSPTLVTPALGVATATSINKVAITAPATGATIVVADGKTLTVSDSLTLSGAGSYDMSSVGDPDQVLTSVTAATVTATTDLELGAGVYLHAGNDPADAGTIRLGNADTIAWEAAPAGTDSTLTVNSSEQFVFSADILNPSNVGQVVKTGLTASGSAANDFSSSTGTFLTSSGLNTISGKVAVKVIATPVAAASPTPGPAALGSANIVTISSASSNQRGVKLVAGVAGDVVDIINTSATGANLYPATGGTINGGAANAGAAIPADTGTHCICTAADTWSCFDMGARSGAAN